MIWEEQLQPSRGRAAAPARSARSQRVVFYEGGTKRLNEPEDFFHNINSKKKKKKVKANIADFLSPSAVHASPVAVLSVMKILCIQGFAVSRSMNIQTPIRPFCLCTVPILSFPSLHFFFQQIQLVLCAALAIKQFPLWH